jgi:hypothetical protein
MLHFDTIFWAIWWRAGGFRPKKPEELSCIKDRRADVGDTGKKSGGIPAGERSENMARDTEQETILAMIRIYCRAHHGDAVELCDECCELRDYALARLGKCPFGPDKPVCSKCPIHCYRPEMRDRVREVMRYAGPRMTLRHPALAVSHLLHTRKPVPDLPRKTKSTNAASEASEHACPNCDHTAPQAFSGPDPHHDGRQDP